MSILSVGLILAHVTTLIWAHPSPPSPASSSGKFSIPIYSHQQDSHVDKRSTGAASSFALSSSKAWSPISIGGQNISVLFDTGSSNFWVYTTKGDRKSFTGGPGGSSLYNPSANPKTFKPISDASFAVSYGNAGSTGSFKGTVGTDMLAVGTTKPVRQAIGMQPFPGKTKDLRGTPFSGVFGLGAGGGGDFINPKQKSWLDNIIPTLDKPLFTVNVGENGDGKWNFGYIDETQYKGNITYIPLNSRPPCGGSGYWMIPKFTVEWEGSKGSLVEKTCVAVDSGADELLLSPEVVDKYYQSIKGSVAVGDGRYVIPCSSNPPDLVFGFVGSASGDIAGSATYSGKEMKKTVWDKANDVCIGSLVASNMGISLLGQEFLKMQFVVFDVGGKRLGFAEPSEKHKKARS